MRAIIEISHLQDIKASLRAYGFAEKENQDIIDRYFCRQEVTKLQDIPLAGNNLFLVKVRTSKRRSTSHAHIFVKMRDKKGRIDKQTVNIKSEEEGIAVLKLLGYKEFFSLQKTSQVYVYHNARIAIEDIADFGLTIYIHMASPEDELLFLKRLGVHENQIVSHSISMLLMQKFAFISSHI